MRFQHHPDGHASYRVDDGEWKTVKMVNVDTNRPLWPIVDVCLVKSVELI